MGLPDGISLDIDADGVATLTLTLPGKVNKIGEPFIRGLEAGLSAALEARPKGIILASGHRDFCVGADIDMIFAERDPKRILEGVRILNGLYRRMETSGIPVVAALTGTALGGGYELALACHRIIALDDPKLQVGLPEVNLGVIPGAGGTQRLPYRIGLQAAMENIAQGAQLRAPRALKVGFVDELASSREELLAKAKAWILANTSPKQPWDRGAALPGGAQPNSEEARMLFVGASAFLYKKTAGVFPAPEAAIRVIHEGTQLTFDRALEVEARAFAHLAVSDQAKDMIRTLWFHRTAAEKQEGLPQVADEGFKKVAILGAGMMGGGLAFVSAKAGYEVVVRDIRQEALDAARKHIEAQAADMKHLGAEARAALLSRVTFTLEAAPLAGADLVIEAVVEKLSVKHAVIREVEPLLAPDAVFASNTSAIPITRLAEASTQKDRFIGLHFFSPVEKMPLLEVIQPAECSDQTLARCLAYGRKIGKTCIVVNDGYGFFTTRLFAAYLLEGCQLVAEGHDPVLVEWAARKAGMVMPPLKVFDEVTLTLGVHAFRGREEVTGERLDMEGITLVEELVKLGRTGKSAGQGFYDWQKRRIWEGLGALVHQTPRETGVDHLVRRLMIAQAAEVSRVLGDGIIRTFRDVDVGAIFGLGFAPNTGGPLAWMDRQKDLLVEMDTLADLYGERYRPSPWLRVRLERGERFYPV